MKIVSILEDQNREKRISITPEIAKKYTTLGFEVCLSKNYGLHLGFKDSAYGINGVKISSNEEQILSEADIVIQLELLLEVKNKWLNFLLFLIKFIEEFKNYDLCTYDR